MNYNNIIVSELDCNIHIQLHLKPLLELRILCLWLILLQHSQMYVSVVVGVDISAWLLCSEKSATFF